MPLPMKLIISVLVYLLGAGSNAERANTKASDAAKDAGMVIAFGKKIYKTEEQTRSHWVVEDEIYICITATASVLEADGKSTSRPTINCVP